MKFFLLSVIYGSPKFGRLEIAKNNSKLSPKNYTKNLALLVLGQHSEEKICNHFIH